MKQDIEPLLSEIHSGNFKSVARAISLVENNTPTGNLLLQKLSINRKIPVIGITGPPGAGKSTLVNEIVTHLSSKDRKIAIIAVDPSSPFNLGALLGDRIRMSDLFLHPNIYIRSLATRGSLGGLSGKIMEVTDVLRSAGFDYIFIETVGVGQSEVEIAGLADTTIVMMVPEAGDEIQTMKAGIMEIADIFVLNKADRPGADHFFKNLKILAHSHPKNNWEVPVLKTIASNGEGVPEVIHAIEKHSSFQHTPEKHYHLLAEKSYKLIQNYRMKDLQLEMLRNEIEKEMAKDRQFNIYRFIEKWLKEEGQN